MSIRDNKQNVKSEESVLNFVPQENICKTGNK